MCGTVFVCMCMCVLCIVCVYVCMYFVYTQWYAYVCFLGLSSPPVGVPKKRNYVDPRNYASTDDALVDFAKEIPQHEINMRKIIGSG